MLSMRLHVRDISGGKEMLKIEKKKIIAALLCASMAASLASCSKDDKKAEETEEETTTSETTEETSSEETEETEETTTEETTEETTVADTGAEYQPFLDGLDQAIADGQMYYEDVEGVNGSMCLILVDSNYQYIYTDLDNNGKSELMIGYEHNDLDGNPVVEVYGFVALDDEGNYNILASSWERQRTSYIGNGNFIMDGSGGADLHIDTLYHFNGETYSFDVAAQLVTDSDEPDPSELPIMYYTVYEGCEWSYEVSERACDDPDALHGDEALARWDEIQAESAPDGNELVGITWNTNADADADADVPDFGVINSGFSIDDPESFAGERS